MSTDGPAEYVLGTGNDELERLSQQHRIWADRSVQAWKEAGIGPGSKVLDLGCGPGYASYDLAQLMGSTGELLALDESPSFVKFVNQQAQSRGLPQLKAQVGDAQSLSKTIPQEEKFDAVYCRWVLCWVPDVSSALREILKVLKPNGKLIVHDYFNWVSMCTAPKSIALEKVVHAAISSFEDRKANVDLCGILPALLRENGYLMTKLFLDQRMARGGRKDSTLIWILQWWRLYAPKLVKLGKLSPEDCEQALKDLDSVENDPDRFFYCPPLFEIVAQPATQQNSEQA